MGAPYVFMSDWPGFALKIEYKISPEPVLEAA